MVIRLDVRFVEMRLIELSTMLIKRREMRLIKLGVWLTKRR